MVSPASGRWTRVDPGSAPGATALTGPRAPSREFADPLGFPLPGCLGAFTPVAHSFGAPLCPAPHRRSSGEAGAGRRARTPQTQTRKRGISPRGSDSPLQTALRPPPAPLGLPSSSQPPACRLPLAPSFLPRLWLRPGCSPSLGPSPAFANPAPSLRVPERPSLTPLCRARTVLGSGRDAHGKQGTDAQAGTRTNGTQQHQPPKAQAPPADKPKTKRHGASPRPQPPGTLELSIPPGSSAVPLQECPAGPRCCPHLSPPGGRDSGAVP
ncbi:PREDICTED: basic proline-rich protein-like [Myotis brandtii]|uniref:basic proline-rich protein-like n=1 Tax=Myotis brandtii TaxID=109478 RepID=UPI000703ED67|nr:PREDICTED: basic proline-rich protein-like [Myotis brandtii]